MSGEVSEKMVSRRKILSQSRDELSYEPGPTEEPEDDVWFTKEKLYKVLSPTPAFRADIKNMSAEAQKHKKITKEGERNSTRYFVLLGMGSSTSTSAYIWEIICDPQEIIIVIILTHK